MQSSSSIKKYLILFSMAGIIICLDQITKIYIHSNFSEGQSVDVIANFFSITYVRNTGAAFGFMRDAQETFRNIFFLTIPPIAAVIIFFMIKNTPSSDKLSIYCLSGLFGGAIGNYIDRLWHGFVVDFLDFHYYYKWSYPAFNVADMAIVIGISLMILMEFKSTKNSSKNTPAPQSK